MKVKIHKKKRSSEFQVSSRNVIATDGNNLSTEIKNTQATVQTRVTLFYSFVKKNIFPLKNFFFLSCIGKAFRSEIFLHIIMQVYEIFT